jgi:hypothetical protein
MPKKAQKRVYKLSKVKHISPGGHTQGFHHVQKHLVHFRYLPVGKYRPGYLDKNTEAALVKYQDFHKLPKTGKFDKSTKARMLIPRCGHPDIIEGVKPPPCPWDKTTFTYAIEDDFDNNGSYIGGDSPAIAIHFAMNEWSYVTKQNSGNGVRYYINFKLVQTGSNPDILIGFRNLSRDPDHEGASDTVLAHAAFPPDCGDDPLPLPIHFDVDHIWESGDETPRTWDMVSVAVHELGHILGLVHSDDKSSVMFPSILGNTLNRQPTSKDIQALYKLYDRATK